MRSPANNRRRPNMRAVLALAVATAASLYGLYGPTFVPDPPPQPANTVQQVQPASTIPVPSMPAPSTSEADTVQAYSEVAVTTTTSTPAVSVGWSGKCTEWWSTALAMGWPEELLPTLGKIMWAESRCQPDAHNRSSDDIGVTQINWDYHQRRVQGLGYSRNDLFVPAVNLMIAYDIYQDALRSTPGCGWWPWKASGDWCGGAS